MRRHRSAPAPAPAPQATAPQTAPSPWMQPLPFLADQASELDTPGWLDGLRDLTMGDAEERAETSQSILNHLDGFFEPNEDGVTGLEQMVQNAGSLTPFRLLAQDFGSNRTRTWGDDEGAQFYVKPGNATRNGVDGGELGLSSGAGAVGIGLPGLNLSPFWEDFGSGKKVNAANIATALAGSNLEILSSLIVPPRVFARSNDNLLGDTDHNSMVELGLMASPSNSSLGGYGALPTLGAQRQTDGVMELAVAGMIPAPWLAPYINLETQDPTRTTLGLANAAMPLGGLNLSALPEQNLTDLAFGRMGMENLADWWMGRDTDLTAGDVGNDLQAAGGRVLDTTGSIARSHPLVDHTLDAVGLWRDGLNTVSDGLSLGTPDIGGFLPFGREEPPAKAVQAIPKPVQPAAPAPHRAGMSYNRDVRPSAAPARRAPPVKQAARRGSGSFF